MKTFSLSFFDDIFEASKKSVVQKGGQILNGPVRFNAFLENVFMKSTVSCETPSGSSLNFLIFSKNEVISLKLDGLGVVIVGSVGTIGVGSEILIACSLLGANALAVRGSNTDPTETVT